MYVIYLDGKIQAKMNSGIWDLPAEVYSRIDTISIRQQLSMDDVHQLLEKHKYNLTKSLMTAGDFKLENNNITLIRRAFPFAVQPEPQRIIRLRFNNNKLYQIEDLVTSRAIVEFKLEPQLLFLLQSQNENRLVLRLHNYPRLLIDTLLLTEDRNFFSHDGISFKSILRAAISNYKAGRTVEGGSTITQQLIKNLFLTNERSFERKFNEVIMAIILDSRYSKNQILETYLNEIYLGQAGNTKIHGFALASQFYFGKPVQELNLEQISLLVSIVKGPSAYNPWRNPNNAIKRRNVVLQVLLTQGVINNELYTMLSSRPLSIQKKGGIAQKQPAFMQAVQREIGAENIQSLSGMRIFTTLDPEIQLAAERAIIETIPSLEKSKKQQNLETAMVVTDYMTGEVRAIVGSADPQYSGFNRALDSRRQIGSLVKPSIYLAALAQPEKYNLNTLLENRKITIKLPNSTTWSPKNYNNSYSAPVTLNSALARSINIPTVNLGMQIGVKNVINIQKDMGWDQITIPNVPSMLLGSYSVSPFEVSKLFQVIANSGRKINLSTINEITDQYSNLLYSRNPLPEQVVAEEAAILTMFAMQNVVNNGTARSLNKNFSQLNLAAKTGTTNGARDSWVVGIDGNNVATIWVGKDDNSETNLTGSTGALAVYQNYLSKAKPKALKVRPSDEMLLIGTDSQGRINCNISQNQIWVWNKNQANYCKQVAKPQYDPNKSPEVSVWDAIPVN